MGEGAAKGAMAFILGIVLFLGACGIIVSSVASDDDACAPLNSSVIDAPAGGSLSPGQQVKPMKTADFVVSSGFGPRDGTMHQGIDMAGPVGTPIHVTGDGVVTFAGRSGAYGNLIKIRHELGTETRYAHLSRIHVKVGDRVSQGDRIGDMGNTGRSTGPHLHYEIRLNGTIVGALAGLAIYAIAQAVLA